MTERPAPDELQLVGAAVSALRRAPAGTAAPTACAVRTRSGRVVAALGLGTRCAEPAALGAALALALSEGVSALATVRHVDDDTTRVTTPCGSCAALLRSTAPGVRVVHLADGLRVTAVAALPPERLTG